MQDEEEEGEEDGTLPTPLPEDGQYSSTLYITPWFIQAVQSSASFLSWHHMVFSTCQSRVVQLTTFHPRVLIILSCA